MVIDDTHVRVGHNIDYKHTNTACSAYPTGYSRCDCLNSGITIKPIPYILCVYGIKLKLHVIKNRTSNERWSSTVTNGEIQIGLIRIVTMAVRVWRTGPALVFDTSRGMSFVKNKFVTTIYFITIRKHRWLRK